MKVLFVNPSVWHLQAIHYRLNRPLGGPILCTVLKQAGHDARFVDAEALQWIDLSLHRYLDEFNPDVVATTALWHNREAVRELAQLAKERVLIVGGPLAMTNTTNTLWDWGYKRICVGEGEKVIKDFVDPPYRYQEPVAEQVENPYPPSFDDIPIPDYDLCYPGDSWYVGNEPRLELPEALSLWTRGCPHNCLFCSNPVFRGKPTRFMSPQRVYDELSVLKKRGIKTVFVYSDELIGMGNQADKWLEDVCSKITSLQLLYKTQGRCSRKQQNSTFQAMVSAGFRVIMWGIESFSTKVLKNLRKGITPDDIWHSLELSHKAGIKNYAFLMVGGIDETEEDFQTTLQSVTEAKRRGLIDFGQVSVMTAEPGSDLYDIAIDNNWLPGETPARSHFEPYLNVPWADHDEVLRRQQLLSEVISGV